MNDILQEKINTFKYLIENAILTKGSEGKESLIRSSDLIELIHDAVKEDLIRNGINPNNIYPHLYEKSPEIRISGALKQKDQDICVIPTTIKKTPRIIDWGLMKNNNIYDEYGYEFSNNTLIINVRSQMSSLAKNFDTLYERTYAEALNLHLRYKDMILGEVYLIPAYEYDDSAVKNRIVAFKSKHTDLEKYITAFDALNNKGELYSYRRCALLIVDFSKKVPKIYYSSDELKSDGLLNKDFKIEYSTLSFDGFTKDLIDAYKEKFNIKEIIK